MTASEMADTKTPRIIIIGTGDTKADELLFMRGRVEAAGGIGVMLDVSILGDPPYQAEHDKHAVAAAAGRQVAVAATTWPGCCAASRAPSACPTRTGVLSANTCACDLSRARSGAVRFTPMLSPGWRCCSGRCSGQAWPMRAALSEVLRPACWSVG